MFTGYVVLAILLSVALAGSGIAKLTRQPKLIEQLTSLNVPAGLIPFLALCEFAGVIGLLIGLWFAPLGVAAAIGVILYFVGATGAHLRVRDYRGVPAPLVFLVLAAVTLALRVASM